MEQEAENGVAVKVGAFTAMKPRLYVEAQKAKDAVEFYKTAFGAEEVSRIMQTKRKAEQEFPLLLAAELKLGSSSIIVSDVLADDSAAPYGFPLAFTCFLFYLFITFLLAVLNFPFIVW